MKLDVMIKKKADELDFQAIYAENDNNMKDYDGPKLVFAKSLKPGDDCKYRAIKRLSKIYSYFVKRKLVF